MLKKLWLVRHGETNFNREHKLQGRLDTPLNEAGLQQAERVARALRGESIDAIWTSPLQRAHVTARCINQYHERVLEVRTELTERSFGELEGAPLGQLVALEKAHSGSLYDFAPEEAESFQQLESRAAKLADSILQSRHEHLLLVAHAGIFRPLIGAFLDMSFEEWFGLAQGNTCINHFQFHAGNVTAYHLNDDAHLL
jgi:broad specificity phosphatase PhoE